MEQEDDTNAHLLAEAQLLQVSREEGQEATMNEARPLPLPPTPSVEVQSLEVIVAAALQRARTFPDDNRQPD
eukprot:CAMPEP_0172891382 /NCGR_PEP_ID=MMETSP1075-20121228/143733_1 /TAXON_ID=2916 /ORGANISM="Ceratium fusus, Strain PA161109" /LENGTH=71 /DNA_ID=CAMNT_0013745835 /DNA_START=52 /DNA_END=265 /DNA_ORIENTATION=-